MTIELTTVSGKILQIVLSDCETVLPKKGKVGCFCVYFRLLKAMAAATTIIMIAAAAMATYVIVGMPPSGGGATLGDGEVGVGVTGVGVGPEVGGGV